MKFFGRVVCFIGAHPDDIELGAGALIAHISKQTEIYCITLSQNDKNPTLKNLISEQNESMDFLGVPNNHILQGSFETRRFPHARQEILEFLIDFNKKFHPEIIFTHTKSDVHQDHATVTGEVLEHSRLNGTWFRCHSQQLWILSAFSCRSIREGCRNKN